MLVPGHCLLLGEQYHLQKVAIVVLLAVGKSAVYSRYNSGPSTLPCGTPDFSSLYLE
jgi:hypothetical protein